MVARTAPPPAAIETSGRFRVALELAIAGDLRFLSHHDELRLLARALLRAGWPVSFTQGFNPRPRLSLPLPRNLGTASDCQWALVDLSEPRGPADLFGSLSGVLPTDYSLRRVVAPAPRATPHAQRVVYTVELDPRDATMVAPRAAQITAHSELWVQRDYGPTKGQRPVDIRPYIETTELDGCTLRLRLRFCEQRTARPSELLTILGLAAEAYNHRLRRAEVQWDTEFTGPTAGPATHERV